MGQEQQREARQQLSTRLAARNGRFPRSSSLKSAEGGGEWPRAGFFEGLDGCVCPASPRPPASPLSRCDALEGLKKPTKRLVTERGLTLVQAKAEAEKTLLQRQLAQDAASMTRASGGTTIATSKSVAVVREKLKLLKHLVALEFGLTAWWYCSPSVEGFEALGVMREPRGAATTREASVDGASTTLSEATAEATAEAKAEAKLAPKKAERAAAKEGGKARQEEEPAKRSVADELSEAVAAARELASRAETAEAAAAVWKETVRMRRSDEETVAAEAKVKAAHARKEARAAMERLARLRREVRHLATASQKERSRAAIERRRESRAKERAWHSDDTWTQTRLRRGQVGETRSIDLATPMGLVSVTYDAAKDTLTEHVSASAAKAGLTYLLCSACDITGYIEPCHPPCTRTGRHASPNAARSSFHSRVPRFVQGCGEPALPLGRFDLRRFDRE
mmetsp:Transcript_67162/g.200626  ORF Transcript_67162/g.200626 Transcript_67162/m.200626 type:complete len:452 (-) Transcript_67162:70-1425(-)